MRKRVVVAPIMPHVSVTTTGSRGIAANSAVAVTPTTHATPRPYLSYDDAPKPLKYVSRYPTAHKTPPPPVQHYAAQEEREPAADIDTSAFVYQSQSVASQALAAVQVAKSYLGTRYRAGGTGPNGFDCSGLVRTSYAKIGVDVPHSSAAIAVSIPTKVRMSDLKPGDLLCFNDHHRNGRIDHVGMVAEVLADGSVMFIHSSGRSGVTINKLQDSYWKRRFRAAVRPVPEA